MKPTADDALDDDDSWPAWSADKALALIVRRPPDHTWRDREIRALEGAGIPTTLIARRFGLSRERVRQIVRG